MTTPTPAQIEAEQNFEYTRYLQTEIAKLRTALKFYAEAGDYDKAIDCGRKADAALTTSTQAQTELVGVNTPQGPCQHCGLWHSYPCPRIKAIEYYPNGMLKRVEYHERWS